MSSKILLLIVVGISASSLVNICDISNNEYFDISTLECMNCANDADMTGRNLHKVPNRSSIDFRGNPTSCKCAPGYVSILEPCSSLALISGTCTGFTCSMCANSVAYTDSSSCTVCGSSTNGTDLFGIDCTCPVADGGFVQVLSERDAEGGYMPSKTCTSCPPGSFVFSTSGGETGGKIYPHNAYQCAVCPSAYMSFENTGVCSCNAGYTQVGEISLGTVSCIPSSDIEAISEWLNPTSFLMHYRNTALEDLQVESMTLKHMLAHLGSQCHQYRGVDSLSSCQALGNLCVLQHNDPRTDVCKLFNHIWSNRNSYSNEEPTWKFTLPWLLYSDSAAHVRESIQVRTPVTFESVMTVVLAAYALNGTMLGFHDLHTSLHFCSNKVHGNSFPDKLQFGYSLYSTYSCNLTSLFSEDQIFYDAYYHEVSTGQLIPIPVLNLALIDSRGRFPNVNTDNTDDIFSRRFFLFDRVSSIAQPSVNTPEVLRYVSKMRLVFNLQGIGNPHIYPPILELTYIDEPGYAEKNTVSIELIVDYTVDTTQIWNEIRACFIVAMVFALLVVLWRLRCWTVRHERSDVTLTPLEVALRSNIDYELLLAAFLIATHTFVVIIFPLTFSICGMIFVFFKMQSEVYIVMPLDVTEYNSLTILLQLLFICQLFHVLKCIYLQSTATVFFIDWEKPPRNRAKEGSAWRKLFVANKWNELQGKRRSNSIFTYFCLAFVLIGLDLQYIAAPVPTFSRTETPVDNRNPVLEFANTTFFWLLIALMQYFWRMLIGEKYVDEPPDQKIIDLATLAKISILVLDEEYHGWYLHCRSPHPYADVCMHEIIAQLDREGHGLLTNRGLDGCPSDVQAFQLFITATWRRKFDCIHKINSNQDNINSEDMALSCRRPLIRLWNPLFYLCQLRAMFFDASYISTEEIAKRSRDLSIFLQGFINQSFTSETLKRVYHEVSATDRFINTPPDFRQQRNSPCILYPDRYGKFLSTCFIGIEVELLLLNIISFSVFNQKNSNVAVALIMTYLLEVSLRMMRERCGKVSLCRSALIDDRFLI